MKNTLTNTNTNINTSNNRILKYDIARCLAITLVILCHASETINSTLTQDVSTITLNTIVHSLGRLGVPIFLFLSGSLLLTKKFETTEDIKNFYKKSLLPLFITYAIWVVIGNIITQMFIQSIELKNVLLEILLFKSPFWGHMWYMPMIIIMYIAIPFISKIVQSFSFKAIGLLILISLISNFILPLINILFKIFNITKELHLLFASQILLESYLTYLIFGYFISNYKQKVDKNLVLLIFAISFILFTFIQLFSFSKYSSFTYYPWYNNIFLLICASCIYLLIMQTDFSKLKQRFINLITYISNISFGIYFVHFPFLYLTSQIYFNKLNISFTLKLVYAFIACTVFCIILNSIIAKNKFLAKYLLLRKH